VWLWLFVDRLHALKLAAKVVFVQVALLDLLGHLSLPLARLLSALQLQPVLVHGEAHCLVKTG